MAKGVAQIFQRESEFCSIANVNIDVGFLLLTSKGQNCNCYSLYPTYFTVFTGLCRPMLTLLLEYFPFLPLGVSEDLPKSVRPSKVHCVATAMKRSSKHRTKKKLDSAPCLSTGAHWIFYICFSCVCVCFQICQIFSERH